MYNYVGQDIDSTGVGDHLGTLGAAIASFVIFDAHQYMKRSSSILTTYVAKTELVRFGTIN